MGGGWTISEKMLPEGDKGLAEAEVTVADVTGEIKDGRRLTEGANGGILIRARSILF